MKFERVVDLAGGYIRDARQAGLMPKVKIIITLEAEG